MSSRANNLTSSTVRVKDRSRAARFSSFCCLPRPRLRSRRRKRRARLATLNRRSRIKRPRHGPIVITADHAIQSESELRCSSSRRTTSKRKETLEKRKELLAQNIIAKKELEESERAVSAAEAKSPIQSVNSLKLTA